VVCLGAKYPRWIVIVSNREKSQARTDLTNIDLADDNVCNVGALGAENGANGGELVEEAV